MSHTHLFFYCFWGNILRIFLEYFWKSFQKNLWTNSNFFSYYFIKVHVQKFSENASVKKIHLQVFYYFKAGFIVFNECFCYFFIHWINFKLIHMFPWYIKNTTISTKFIISTSNWITTLKHWKTKQTLHLLWYLLLWLHPLFLNFFYGKWKILQKGIPLGKSIAFSK
jgi:hypothetical protein